MVAKKTGSLRKGRLSKSAFLSETVETYGDIVFDVRKQY
jgi:hypothetical protein